MEERWRERERDWSGRWRRDGESERGRERLREREMEDRREKVRERERESRWNRVVCFVVDSFLYCFVFSMERFLVFLGLLRGFVSVFLQNFI